MPQQKCLGFQKKKGDGSMVQNFKLIGEEATSEDPLIFQTSSKRDIFFIHYIIRGLMNIAIDIEKFYECN